MIADVDVIVPVRNGGRLLRDAVDSVLDQDGVSVRVIVVDDGSIDGSVDRLPADGRITILRNEGNGIPCALNTAIAAGGAPLVARQDADDVSLPGRLMAEAAFLERAPDVGLVATAFEVLVGDRVVTTISPTVDGMLDKNPICAGTTVVRRGVLARAGGYRVQFELSSDYDCWLRCEEVAGVAILPDVTYRYRLTSSMATIRHGGRQAAFAGLARASARARRTGEPDPAAASSFIASPLGGATADEAEVAAWWAREFAALGSRSDALQCARSAWSGLGWSDRARVLWAATTRPRAQAEWP